MRSFACTYIIIIIFVSRGWANASACCFHVYLSSARWYPSRVEVGEKDNFKKKLARSSLTWAGHAEMMGDENLANRADAQNAVRGERRGNRAKITMSVA